jgi:biotin transporter BioY
MQPRTKAVTLMDALFPTTTLARNIFLALSFTVLIALSARISFAVPWSSVPITGQTFAILLTAALLGSRLGTATVIAYLAQGAMGLPVFAYGGGIAYFTGPTAGFLLGFVPMAFVVGYLCEHGWDRRPWTVAIAFIMGSVWLYVFGLSWLARFVAADSLLSAGFYPFIPGDLTKIALAAIALPSGWALVNRVRSW